HAPADDCNCRKPLTGLLEQISERFSIPLENVPFIGDNISDIKCAQAVNAQPILVRTGKGERTETQLESDTEIPVFNDLSEAVNHLLDN
ncbi:MAG: HAD hydrolase-like protein, partial [Eudoraea sp.]|nr:HAD hydrolase-like protein [Eudoraea sp.]